MKMKYIIYFILFIAVCIGFTGCYNEKPEDSLTTETQNVLNEFDKTTDQIIETAQNFFEETKPEETKSEVIKKNPLDDAEIVFSSEAIGSDYYIVIYKRQHYIVFEDQSKYEAKHNMGVQLQSIEFDYINSVEEFKNIVLQGKLSDYEKRIIVQSFPKDDIGIKICDFNNLFEPVLPENVTVKSVCWSGIEYSYRINIENGVSGFIHYYSKETFWRLYEEKFEDRFFNTNAMVTSREYLDSETQKIYYETSLARLMVLRYELESEMKASFIDKTYMLEVGHSYVTPSATVPYYIDVFGYDRNDTMLFVEDGFCFYKVHLSNLTEDLDFSWLLQFGLSPYVENGNEIM